MKRIFFAVTLMAALLLPVAPQARAEAAVSLNFFYDNLSPQGSWIEVGDYGYCFQPNVAVSNPDWRPYADGYWAYTDVGWTWVSYEDFGWATYHYGNWANLDDYGWVWVPGYEWGPAWVSWRTGGDYIGWAPLPPPRREVVYEGRAITGAVDVTFGIGPLYYNFVDIRYIGEPVLRGRIIEPRQNVTIINRTVNVTNITYNNTVVINNGPDINRLNRYSTRPIQRLKLQREVNIDFNGRRGNLNRVNGDALVVAAPAVERSQQKIAPKQVKAKVDKPRVEMGWRGIDNRAQVEAEMKKQDPKNVPPPTFQPPKNQNAQAEPKAGGQPPQNESGEANANQQTGAQPNEAAPANANDRQAERAARRAGRERREENTGANTSPNAAGAASAEENATAQPNEAAPANANDRRANRAARRAAREGRGNQPAATKPDQTGAAAAAPDAGEQNADQPNQSNAREKRAERRRAERAKEPQAGQQEMESEPAKEKAEMDRPANQGQERPKRAKRPSADEPTPANAASHPSDEGSRRSGRRAPDQTSNPQNATSDERAQPPRRARTRPAADEPGSAPEASANPRRNRPRQEAQSPNQSSDEQTQGGQKRERKAKKKNPNEEEPQP